MTRNTWLCVALFGVFVGGVCAGRAAASGHLEEYFLVRHAETLENGTIRMTGQFILNGGVDLSPTDAEANAAKKPQIKIPKLFEVKWILPPRTSTAYGSVKWFAESMGYDTVENDDLTYPPPR